MSREDILKRLIEDSGETIRSFAIKIGAKPSTLYSVFERGIGKSSVDLIISICSALGITVEQLNAMDQGKEYEEKSDMSSHISTIAAHMEGINPTEEELEKITEYIDFVFKDAFKE